MKEESRTLKETYQQALNQMASVDDQIGELSSYIEGLMGDYERISDIIYNRSRIGEINASRSALRDMMESLYFGRVDFHAYDEVVTNRSVVTHSDAPKRRV